MTLQQKQLILLAVNDLVNEKRQKLIYNQIPLDRNPVVFKCKDIQVRIKQIMDKHKIVEGFSTIQEIASFFRRLNVLTKHKSKSLNVYEILVPNWDKVKQELERFFVCPFLKCLYQSNTPIVNNLP